MSEPVQVRGHWVVFLDGKKLKFKTEDEAWEALGGRPEKGLFDWLSQEKSSKNEIITLLDTVEDSSSS
jgi:hypothetical protein